MFMRANKSFAFFSGLCLLFCQTHTIALAQNNLDAPACFQAEELPPNMGDLVGVAQSDARQIIDEVTYALGLSATEIIVRECRLVENAVAWVPPEESGLTRGRYIVYNPDWAQLAASDNRWQAVGIFGHELGHFVGGHFFENSGLSRREKETQADRFAGCAVGRLDGPWFPLQDLLRRIRSNHPGNYPSFEQSHASAKQGYVGCGGKDHVVDLSVCRGLHRGWGSEGENDWFEYEVDCTEAGNCSGYLLIEVETNNLVDCM